MFATIILGIGFILIAGVFPVGLSQTKSTLDETVAASVARQATAYLEQTATDATMPPLGSFVPVQIASPVEAVRRNMIQPSDPRYAWVALYKRDPGSNVAQVIVFVTQSANTYSVENDFKDFGGGLMNLQPRLVKVDIADGLPNDTITVTTSGGDDQSNAAASGAFVAITVDNIAAPDVGRFNGRIYRLGNRVAGTTNQFTLAPGYEFTPEVKLPGVSGSKDVNGLAGAAAWIIGRSRTGNSPANFEGNAQDVAIYATFVTVK